jgi:hypothetical protein
LARDAPKLNVGEAATSPFSGQHQHRSRPRRPSDCTESVVRDWAQEHFTWWARSASTPPRTMQR